MSRSIPCNLCNHNTKPFTCAEEVYHYCTNCELIWLDDSLKPKPLEEKDRYDTHDNTPESKGYVNFLNKFLDKGVRPFVTEGHQTALDFGCGPGPVLQMLLENEGFETDIYDPYYAPERVFEGKQYDLVTSTEVFEHFYEPWKELECLCGVTKPQGLIAVMTMFHPGIKDFCSWWYKEDPTHVTFYTLKTFEWIERNFPLEVICTDSKRVVVFRKING